MQKYILKRTLLIIPTLLIIMLINFAIIQTAPGGPVEQILAQINNHQSTTNIGGIDSTILNNPNTNNFKYTGSQGVDEEFIKKLEQTYALDKSATQRFLVMLKNYLTFNFGTSFYQDKTVISLILEKLPVSISLGLFSTILVYLISIPLGIKKAVRDGSKFDLYSSSIIIIAYAIPAFLFAILLIILFASGNFLEIFPLRGLTSENFHQLNLWQKILDYLHHLVLPITAMTIGGFASLTFLVKNSFLEEIKKQYVITAYAKGLNEKKTLFNHIFRNAMLIIIAGLPSAIIAIFFTSSMLIEIIFSLDGIGLLGYEAAINRDYPIIFSSLYIFTLIGLITSIISDISYNLVDKRINFEKN